MSEGWNTYMGHTLHKIYLLERIKDGGGYRKGERIWAHSQCKGWRVIEWEWA